MNTLDYLGISTMLQVANQFQKYILGLMGTFFFSGSRSLFDTVAGQCVSLGMHALLDWRIGVCT
jgi:hypothetical protein